MQIDWLSCPECTGVQPLIRRDREILKTIVVRRGIESEPIPQARPDRCLVVVEGDPIGAIHELRFGRWKIGRAPRAEAETDLIVIEDDFASQEHFGLVIGPAAWLLQDLGSTNGTWVNGKRVRGAQITQGDRIRLGTTTLQAEGAPGGPQ